MSSAPPILAWMHTLADPTRLRICRLIERQELTVAELCAVIQCPQSTVSRHLRVLADEGWVRSRREGTSAMYRMTLDDLDESARKLWLIVREQAAGANGADHDDRRLQRVLADRQTRSQTFFATTAGQWDKLRGELFGIHFDKLALAGLLDADWTIGDIGCGTGQLAEALAPFVKRVIAVDGSSAMLKAARRRLKPHDNVEVRRGEVQALPIDDAELHAATLSLVLHHVPDPAAALAELARTLMPGGRLLIVDMQQHDRTEYQQTMGHVWLGFTAAQVRSWLADAGLTRVRLSDLPADPAAKGPALFVAAATRQ